ncbi:hypothetical protein GCM10011391_10720 [Pullulanibacillus camelliae]|uniref:PepSY domain-containing protein n=1 Tax=Pullulanibacillus camelliae TaxID=1707096 RepID=A0A8J2VNG5_9BACL|nr:hypothetical protein [Pullulanibacillus camelliae]GGE33877.1 hypothetical protein GCM10011391_10720 [Pullulanibacillus camelliae]
MSRVRKIQPWLSLITALLLFLASITGLYMGLSANAMDKRMGQGFSFNRGATPNGDYNQNNNQGRSSDQNNNQGAASGSGQFNDGDSSDNNNVPAAGNFSRGMMRDRQGADSLHMKLTQLLQGNYNGTDIRWLIDLASSLLLLLAVFNGIAALQSIRDKTLQKE